MKTSLLLLIVTLSLISCSTPKPTGLTAEKLGLKKGFLNLVTDSYKKFSTEQKLDASLLDLLLQFMQGAQINNFMPQSTTCINNAQQMIGQLISQTQTLYSDINF
jgi:hypothetical protein